MKKLLVFASLLLLLTACPIGLDYAPGEIGKEEVNSKLIGTWMLSNPDDAEAKKFSISKIDKYSYKVEVVERGEMYSLETDNLTLYETTINGLHVLYLKPDNEEQYYMYQYKLEGNTLTIADIPLLDGGIDAVTSTESLRKQIESSMTMETFYAEPLTYEKQ